MNNKKHPLSQTLVSLLATAAVGGFHGAASAQGFSIEEIVVTAQKREQSQQDVGISISAFGEDAIEKLGLGDMEQLAAAIPNLQALDEAAGLPSFRIRGVGLNEFQAGFDSPVGIHLDEVFLSKPFLASMGFFDVHRVEALKGPQGTVFGRNTTGGAVNYYSNRPSQEFEAGLKASYGRHQRFETEAFVSGPLSENLLGRVAVQAIDQQEGPYRNLFNGDQPGEMEQYQVRGQLNWQGEETDVLLSMHWGSKEAELTPYDNLFQTVPGGAPDTAPSTDPIARYTVNQDYFPTTDSEAVGASLRIEHETALGTLTSLTAYETFERDNREDSDNTPLATVNIDWYSDIDQFTQELRLGGSRDSWTYLVGVYYERDELTTVERTNASDLIGLQLGADHEITTDSLALFTSHEFSLSDNLSVILGARYTKEDNEIEGDTFAALPSALSHGDENRILELDRFDIPEVFGADPADIRRDRSDEDFNIKLGVNYFPSADQLLFASVSTGFRSGGFDLAFGATSLETFDPEDVTAWELGYKSSWWEDTLTLNASLFYTEVEDYQTNVNLAGELVPRRRNIGVLESQGLELEAVWQPNHHWRIQLSAGYTDAEIAEVNLDASGQPFSVDGVPLKGNQPVNTPELSLGAIVGYHRSLSDSIGLELVANYSWNDERYLEIQNADDHWVDSYHTLDLSASLVGEDGRWRVTAWGKNVTDEDYLRYINDVPAFGLFLAINAEPANYGVSFSYQFQ
ncbi:TonB-dependent receptor [Pseudomaricurvus alkylphenolicus]|uniref:TonB-dependent receptor n=1 Tax=Pseudomaricurvus alkylphenolicus TaxID=1306991 RepID=UPI001420352F|nr:TonB-dependent receptor [Pseudomaricurvus alkylphenolicus]NIB40186.1 TonB-dependent receptor [Pseudomaricurvus alkylphenolicus]